MEIEDENTFTKKCYKLADYPVLDNLNIFYSSVNSKLFLWNKYQIFVYSDCELECLEKIFNPDFQIHLVLASNNYILCQDFNDNIHITSLKFKSLSQRNSKFLFQPRDQNIKTIIKYKEDLTLSLKYEADAYFISLNKINSDFQLIKKVILLRNDEVWPIGHNSRDKYLLISHSIQKQNSQDLNNIFMREENNKQTKDLVLLSFDRLTLYGCLFFTKLPEEEVILVKLFEAPAEICNIEIRETDKLYILIGLKMGTLIKLCLNESSRTPQIVHLNTSLSKILAINDSLIYTDGTTMWKAENFQSIDLKFTQIFLKNVKDFTKCGDLVICTTYSNIIYKFSLEDEKCYLIPKEGDGYCPAERLLNYSESWSKLFQEIDKNKEIAQKLEKEENYIITMCLSLRQDIVGKAIDTNVKVFENYEGVKTQDCTLTQDVSDYFGENTWQILVNITNSGIHNTLNSIFSHLYDCTSINITISTKEKILKTTSIKMEEPLKTVNYLIPIKLSDETEIKVKVKIIVNIPGPDSRKSLTVLYRKEVYLTPDYFIKTIQKPKLKCLKNSLENIEICIQKFNTTQFGNDFEFTDISKLQSTENEWTFFVKLLNNYKEIFENDDYFNSAEKSKSIILQMRNEEFLKGKREVAFTIGNEKVTVKIQDDGFSIPLLILTGRNAKITYSLRNYFAKMIYKEYEDCKPRQNFISYSYYTTTENFQKAVKKSISSSTGLEEFLPLMNQFERNILGALPL